MLKRLCLAFAGLFAFVSVAAASGTIAFSLSQQLDNLGKPLAGCKLYTIQAGTVSTPQNAFFDSGLTLPQPNPMVCDAYGRLPQFFLADGSIKVRLTNSVLSTVFTADNILVIGPSGGGGGGGGGVDPTTVLQTGDIKSVYGTNILSGFVRTNGRSIGSGPSGATERANADCQSLFTLLWNTDASLPVSGGRGASAAADWAANKTIQLPDFRGRVMAGFDDMGSSFAGRLTTATMTGLGIGSVSTIGETNNILLANIPPYTPTGVISVSNGAITVTNGGITVTNGAITNGAITGTATVNSADNLLKNGIGAQSLGGGGVGFGWSNNPTVGSTQSTGNISASQAATTQATTTASQATTTASQASTTGTVTLDPQGGSGIPLKIVQPTILVTHYMKL